MRFTSPHPAAFTDDAAMAETLTRACIAQVGIRCGPASDAPPPTAVTFHGILLECSRCDGRLRMTDIIVGFPGDRRGLPGDPDRAARRVPVSPPRPCTAAPGYARRGPASDQRARRRRSNATSASSFPGAHLRRGYLLAGTWRLRRFEGMVRCHATRFRRARDDRPCNAPARPCGADRPRLGDMIRA